MKAALLGPGRVELRDLPEPSAARHEIVVRMRACGICATDLEKVRGHYSATGKIGHEPVGVVHRVGEGVPSLREGMRVFVHHHVPCYGCEVCRIGAYTYCPQYQRTNIDPGGFSEFFLVPHENVSRGAVVSLPEHLADAEATLIEPLACCVEALRATPFAPGQSALVVGLGPVGLLYARLLRASGASRVYGADLSPFRREAGLRSGVDVVYDPRRPAETMESEGGLDASGSFEVDLAVVATGSPTAVTEGYRHLRRGATLNLFGLPARGSRLEIDLQELYLRGIRVLPTYATTERGTGEALALLSSGRVRGRDLITHQFPLTEVTEAFDQASRTEDTLKVVVTGEE
jgi:L-iditol 2-dehydrogenase